MNHGLGEARHRQSGDDLLSEWKNRKFQRKRGGKWCEGLSFRTELLATAFLFAFVVLLLVSTVFNKKVVLDSAQLRSHRQQKRLQLTEEESYDKLVIPSSDQRVLQWLEDSDEFKSLKEQKKGTLRIGLVNFAKPDVVKWRLLSGGQKPTVFRVERPSLPWSDFFPEDVDRDEEVQNARCRDMPLPTVQENLKLDIVVANIPCEESGMRDVNRLQASLVTAHIASKAGSKSMHVVAVSKCRLYPNIFRCKELLRHENGISLYQLDLDRIEKLLDLPVGSCKAAQAPVTTGEHDVSREAYATILHSVESYVCGAIILGHSIRKTDSTRDLVMLVDQHIKPEEQQALEAAGWKVHMIERIRNPKAKLRAYNEWNYSKFRLWQLTQYDKIVFIDADVVVVQNMDFLFGLPEISAARNHGNLFNSGVMVIEPCNCTFEYLVDNIGSVESYNGGDQGYLNEIFTWWHRLPRTINFLKHFDDDIEENKRKIAMFTADNPPAVYALHFLGTKPWLCGREADCNRKEMFLNNEVHSKWWKLHDTLLPQDQRKFCLKPKRKVKVGKLQQKPQKIQKPQKQQRQAQQRPTIFH